MPIAFVDVAQAVTTGSVGPLAFCLIETSPDAMFAMIIGTKNGEILRGPPLSMRSTCSSMVPMPPMPDPI